MTCAEAQADREHHAYLLAWNTWNRYLPGLSDIGRLDLDDLRGAAMLGAATALAKWDPTRGTAFASFAISYIKGALREEARRQDHLSRGYRTKARAHQRATAEESEREFAARYEAETGKRWRFQTGDTPDWALPPLSLDEPVLVGDDDYEPIPRGELWQFQADVDVAEEALDAVESETLWAWVALLPENERNVVTRYYRDNLYITEIAREIDRSKSRAYQILDQAIERLREWLGE